MSISEQRVEIMTMLYQVLLYKKNKMEYNIDILLDDKDDFIKNIVNGVLEKETELEELANKYLNNWKLDRLGFTDQAIIKMGIYEILYTDTPNKVCINEAVELSKKYSDDSVVGIVNGVLDKVYHNEVSDAE